MKCYSPNHHPARYLWPFCVILLAVQLTGIPTAVGFTPTSEKQIIRLPLSKTAAVVDGVITGNEYDDAVILGGSFKGWGVSPRPQSPTVYLKRDQERLYILYDNPLKEGERPSMRGAVPDNSGICMGNAVELFFLPHLPDGELLEYIQFAGNARNCVYDALSRPQVGVTYVAEFTKPWRFQNRIVSGHWYSEISSTFADLDIRGAANGEYFDFDCGRDGGTGPDGVHSYTMAYHTIQSGNGVRVIFDDTAPVAQWLSFGDFENNAFNPRLRLKSTGKSDTYTVSFALTEGDSSKELFAKSVPVRLGPADSQEATVAFPLEKNSKGVARYRIVDSQGTIIFYRELAYQANATAPPLYQKSEPKPLVVTARMAPSYGRFGVTADIIDYPGDKSTVTVEARAFRDGSAEPLGTVLLGKFKLDYAEGVLDVGKIEEGTYHVKFRALERGTGHPLGQEQEVTLARKRYEWENNSLGISDKAPDPWTPLKVEGRVVHCWGREYSFTGLGLPKSIPTLQPEPARGPKVQDALASPVCLVAEANGKILAWKEGGSTIVSQKEAEVVVSGSAATMGLKAEVRGALDYDGFYQVHLTVTPTTELTLDSIRLEVPVPTNGARLFYSVGESMRSNKTFADLEGLGDGVLWNSKSAARNSLIQGNFLPVAWLGDEDRGVAWMCDNDRTWQIAFDKPCLDVVRKGSETVFRMHLVNRPGKLTRPIVVTFGLQATPIRPRPPGGSWKQVEWYGWGHFDMPLIYDKCFDAYRQGKLPENGPWYRTPEARAQNRWWRYGCFNSDRVNEADPAYGQIVKDFGAEWYSESVFVKCQNKAHQDFELWAWKQWHDVANMDGLYFDNTFPAPSINLLDDTAWIDEEGRLRASYAVMAYRDFMKRLRRMLLDFGPPPVMMSHITDTPISGYLGFADFWLDGESGGYPDSRVKNPDFVDRWYSQVGLANLRITLGRQWGVMPQYLYTWGIEPTYAVLGMFDLENRYTAMGRQLYHEFGRFEKDVEFVPYWTTQPAVKVVAGGPDVLLTAWKRPGQARLLISNLSREDRAVAVKFDLKALNLPEDAVALDEREGSRLAFQDGVARDLEVKAHNYRTIIAARPGLYQPLPPNFGQALQPPRDQWVAGLCDDFSKLDAAWTQTVSPRISLATNDRGVESPAFARFLGCLKIRTSTHLVARLSRGFNLQDGSVQVKLREPTGQYGAGFGPSLQLVWDPERSIRITAWEVGPEDRSDRFYCQGVAGQKTLFGVSGEKPRAVNWVKITLKPTAIEFHTSTDGQTWKPLSIQPRTGFEGAPAQVVIGHGGETDGPAEGYSFDSYFGDLIVAKLP